MRSGRAALWRHAIILALLLGAVGLAIGTRSDFITDESYVQIQLDTLDHTGGWTLPHPLRAVDPEGQAFPLHGATQFEDGFTLYGKHPALIYLFRPLHTAFGTGGLVALSIAGTVAAAFVAAQLAERLRPGTGRLALWLTGLGTPLFFDAFVVHAHTLAAAGAALSAYSVLRVLEQRRPAWGVTAVVASLAVALLRTEGTIYAGALGLTVLVLGLARRRVGLVVLGGCVGAAGAAAVVIDRAWATAVGGGALVGSVPHPGSGAGYLATRSSSLTYSLLMPGYRGVTGAEALGAVGALLLIVGVVLVHRRPADRVAVAVPVLGAGLLLARSALEWGPVPGFIPASCVLVAGLLIGRRADLRPRAVRVILITALAFISGVLATQYESGGHTEWGGRYLALSLPLLAAVAACFLRSAWGEWHPSRVRMAQGAMVCATVGLALLSVVTLRSAHDRNRNRADRVLSAAAEMGRASDGGLPVVVTEDDQVPRLARGRYDDVRFLLVRPGTLETYLARLGELGIEDVLVVSIDPTRTLDRLGPYEPAGPVEPHALQYENRGGLIRLQLR